MIKDLHTVLWELRDERSSTNQSWKSGKSGEIRKHRRRCPRGLQKDEQKLA